METQNSRWFVKYKSIAIGVENIDNKIFKIDRYVLHLYDMYSNLKLFHIISQKVQLFAKFTVNAKFWY